MSEDKKEFGGWWIYVLVLLLISTVAFTTLRYVGVLGKTVVEREVFENSYQKTAGDSARLNRYQAQLAEINSRLYSTPDDADLRAQKAMLEVQIKGMK